MENKEEGNPLVTMTLWFKDGAGLRQVFTTPVPQGKAMAALGRMIGELGSELKIEPVVKGGDQWQHKSSR